MDRFLKNKGSEPDTRAHRLEHGFTLLEVMVAMAVLAIAMTAIYRMQAQTMTMSAQARFYSLAPQLAKGKLSELERLGLKDVTDDSGDFGTDYPSYNWSVRMEDLPSDLLKDKKYHLIRIEVTISQNEAETYQLQTYRFYAE